MFSEIKRCLTWQWCNKYQEQIPEDVDLGQHLEHAADTIEDMLHGFNSFMQIWTWALPMMATLPMACRNKILQKK